MVMVVEGMLRTIMMRTAKGLAGGGDGGGRGSVDGITSNYKA